ncbi:metal-dependent hydrolase [Foetidibacter luteolus]|uniref:metal-dependent hydrolase n=1 Tax=Foetidibacter luteolus TaxID=2608880 RepID=UPI00129B0B9A|nr:metal-dependent hydrolase [Foetidibacter luteolus]
MLLTYYGQSCFSVTAGGKKILFDPFISGNPLAKHIDINTIEADYIFISHGHTDHTLDLVAIAKRTGALCIAAAEIADWLSEKQGIKNVRPINHGGPVTFDFGKARGVNAIHSSSLPDGSYAGNPLGFVFNTGEGDFYFAGDTALTLDMQLIPMWAKLNFAVLPIGGNFTMDVADAIRAADFAECATVVGVHYNTFGLIEIDTQQAVKDFEAQGKKLLLPGIGETIEVE